MGLLSYGSIQDPQLLRAGSLELVSCPLGFTLFEGQCNPYLDMVLAGASAQCRGYKYKCTDNSQCCSRKCVKGRNSWKLCQAADPVNTPNPPATTQVS